MKYVDDSGDHIDLFSEIDRNHAKMIEDEFSLINDKTDFPISDFVTPVPSIDENNGFDTDADIKNEQLMMEFNSILDAVSNAELTPPQTPPPEIFHEMISPEYQQINIPTGHYEIFDYQPHVENSPTEQYVFVQETASPSSANFYEESNQGDEIVFESILSSPADVQREAEVVEEIVLAHSRNASDIDDNASQFSSTSSWSPRSEYSSGSSCSSQYGDYESSPRKSSSGLKGVTKKRSRGYGRNPEEKKSRKKEQNKNAATRYRQKKKVEIEIILDEEKILADKNRKLMGIYKETRREVKYLKSLLRDLFKARGFIQ
jgi:cyclic AMP-dependent transcription factor ATF-4